jgi:tRNA threonylcarbamoyladenosine biosynthesis protein TsaE
MLRFIARRLLETIPVLLVIITATFFMIRFVPGGPFTAEKAVTPEILRNLEAHYGLDKPLYRQYFDYLGSLLQGDLGAGKTCLVQGIALGLGITEPITSPTFALAQHYSGQLGDGRPTALVHLDLYRLEQPGAADELLAQEEEEAGALAAVLAVEWPERLSHLPNGTWRLQLELADAADPDRGRIARLSYSA